MGYWYDGAQNTHATLPRLPPKRPGRIYDTPCCSKCADEDDHCESDGEARTLADVYITDAGTFIPRRQVVYSVAALILAAVVYVQVFA